MNTGSISALPILTKVPVSNLNFMFFNGESTANSTTKNPLVTEYDLPVKKERDCRVLRWKLEGFELDFKSNENLRLA